MALVLLVALSSTDCAVAQKKYDLGATDAEIKVGNTAPYSGPASAYGVLGKVEAAYFKKINDEGGINGRQVTFISYDDAYSPPKTVEQARKLIESDEVLLIFSSSGTAANSAIAKYMNTKKVPQLFVASYSEKWNDPARYPWTMGLGTSLENEGRLYAGYLLNERPDARIAVLFQNDDAGKEMLQGLKKGLGSRASMIIAEDSYEISEPTIDTHVVKLRDSNADTFFTFASPKFTAQSIRKAGEIGWRPLHFIFSVATSIGATIKPAGFDNAQGIISATYLKDPQDPQWTNDPGMKTFLGFLTKYMPNADRADSLLMNGYLSAQALAQVLKQCGDDLTRENVMRQAANLRDVASDVLLPGITINTGPRDFAPLKDMQLMRFTGTRWQLFGQIVRASDVGRNAQ
jgi:branched-chain amino acid transport system substrate-binding protein